MGASDVTAMVGRVAAVWCYPVKSMQGEEVNNLDVLRTPARHNRLPVLSLGSYPCFGVNGVIHAPGSVGRGDEVRFIGAPIDDTGEAAQPQVGS